MDSLVRALTDELESTSAIPTVTTVMEHLSTTPAVPTVRAGYTGMALKFVNRGLDDVLRPVLLNRGMLALSIFFIVGWHVLRAAPQRRDPMVRTFSHGILIIQIYYSQYLHEIIGDYPFIVSCAVLFIDSVVLWGLSILVVDKLLGIKYQPEAHILKTKVTNRYMQVDKGFRRAGMYFTAQFGLMMYYIYNLNIDPVTHNVARVSFLKWFFAVIITSLAGEEEVGTPFNFEFWEKLMDNDFTNETRYICGIIPMTYRREWQIRRAFSFIINHVFRRIILGTAPILLCVNGSMDFIKDCLAIFFITKLDDLDDPKELDEVLASLRSRHRQSYAEKPGGTPYQELEADVGSREPMTS